MEKILTVNNLTKKFGFLTAVKDLSFSIEKGNVYGILGPNGSGKSTTLGIVLNVVNRTNGEFSWFDGNTSTHDALKKVGAIIERPNFYPYMTAVQNLKLVCKIKEVPSDKIEEKLEKIEEKYQIVLEALFFQGMTQQEASDELDIPLGTIKSRLKIGLRELKKIYNPTAMLTLIVSVFM